MGRASVEKVSSQMTNEVADSCDVCCTYLVCNRMLNMASCEVPCDDGYCQVDKNQHSKSAAMKVKNENN